MTKFVTAALGFVVSIAVGVGLAEAHDRAPEPIMTSETIDSLRDHGVGSQATDGAGEEVEGTLEILHEDREDGSSHYRHFLSTRDGKRLSLEGVQHPDLLTGDGVRVRGVRSGQTLQLQTTSAQNLEVVQYAPVSNTLGLQKIVILMVNFSNDPSHPATIDSVKLDMARSDAFFRENSYGQTWLSVDVFGWYTLPIANTNCDEWSIKASADQAASASGVNLAAYTRRVYLFPWTSNCQFSGMGTVGGSPSTAWINGPEQLFVIDHELGHNLGLWHSHSISCPPAVLGPTCTTLDYGDSTDTMGGSGGHYNAFQKQRLGWLGYGVSPPITSVQSSGTYTIAAYEAPGTTPKALKIQRGPASAQAFFFVELRTPAGLDAFLPSSGVFIHMASDNNSNSSYLLDMTPETQFAWYYEFLAVGKGFTDPASGITIQTVSANGTSATIAVTMGGVPSTPTALVGVGPQLTWTAGTPTTQTGFVVERAAGPTATFASIATTTAPNYLDPSGVGGQCYRVRATNAAGMSGPSNVTCAPSLGEITLTITGHSPIGREMTFAGTLTGSTSLSATIDGTAIAAKYIMVDRVRKTWTVKATALFMGPHTFAVAAGSVVVSTSFTVPK
jgi:hypothetical protein